MSNRDIPGHSERDEFSAFDDELDDIFTNVESHTSSRSSASFEVAEGALDLFDVHAHVSNLVLTVLASMAPASDAKDEVALASSDVFKVPPIMLPVGLASIPVGQDDVFVVQDEDEDFSDDDVEDLIVFEDSSFSTEASLDTECTTDRPLQEATYESARPFDRRAPLSDRMSGAVTQARQSMVYVGNKIQAFSDSLDEKAEGSMKKVEVIVKERGGMIKDQISVMDVVAGNYAQQFCLAGHYSKARATASAVRSKTGETAAKASASLPIERIRKNLGTVRSKVPTAPVAKGWNAARDKMQAAFSNKGSSKSSMSQGGA